MRSRVKVRRYNLTGAEKLGARLLPWLLVLTLVPVYLNSGPGLSICLLSLVPTSAVFLAPKRLVRHFLVLLIACVYLVMVEIYNKWSPFTALREPMFLLQFAFPCSLVMLSLDMNARTFEKYCRRFVLACAAAAVTVIFFRFFNDVEIAYARSPLAMLFNSPSSTYMVDQTLGVNVLEPSKAGGVLYLNGNQSAAFMITVLALSQMLFTGRAAIGLAALFLAGLIATGSKTPWFAAPIAAALAYLLHATRKQQVEVRTLIFTSALALFVLLDQAIGITARMAGIETFQVRMRLWSRASQHLSEYALMGTEPGYWDQLWSDYGSLYWTYLPVHNYTLSLMMVGGIVAVLLVYMQFCIIIARLSRMAGSGNIAPYWAIFAFTYVILYAQVENFTAFGDLRVSIVLSLCYALGHRRHNRARHSSTSPTSTNHSGRSKLEQVR